MENDANQNTVKQYILSYERKKKLSKRILYPMKTSLKMKAKQRPFRHTRAEKDGHQQICSTRNVKEVASGRRVF